MGAKGALKTKLEIISQKKDHIIRTKEYGTHLD